VNRHDSDPIMFGNAEAYDRFMGRWSRLVAPLLVDFGNVPETGRVLDAGSGTGTLAFTIAEREPGVHVTGIDPSKEFVNYAAGRNPFSDRLSFEVGDAQDLHFADATFGASLSLLVFNFIPDAARALREMRRVTQPGGWISAAVWDYGDQMRMLRVFWDAAVDLDPRAEQLDEKRMPLCRAAELSELWRQGRLEQVEEQPLNITMKFDSFEDYWEPFLLGQGPAGAYVRSVQKDLLRELRSAVRRRLSISSDNEPFALPARAWCVRGMISNR
jgi:SAM-dependent methyltransferase